MMKLVPLEDVFWFTRTAKAPSPCSVESGAAAEVAVIGAGYLGLSTALHLSEAGVKTVVMEANAPGHGASGRNSGFVVPAFVSALGPGRVRQLLGDDRAEQLCRLAANSGNAVFNLIREKRIECDAEQSGWLQPAHGSASADLLKRRREEWADIGKNVDLLDSDETAALTGAAGYRGALLDRSGGQLNPLGFARGLAKAAKDGGAGILTESPVTGIDRLGGRWRIRWPRGHLYADRVLVATNAMDGALVPRFSRSILPLVVWQIATSPLDSENRATILPRRQCSSDTRRDIFAYRWTPDGRLLTGGLGAAGFASPEAIYRKLLRRLRSILPITGPCKVEFGWNGAISITPDLLPRLYAIDKGLYAAVGCCGRGLALSTALGENLAAFLRSGDEGELCVPLSLPAPIPGRSLARHLPALLLPWSRLRDSVECGRPPKIN
ncbi:MAG: FAD-dependent oxidoreductase [Albidovulum sp.]|nr:FAD-dependent oxidoreductase [Albidovulum sp.]